MSNDTEPSKVGEIILNRLNLDFSEISESVEENRKKLMNAFPSIQFRMSTKDAFMRLLGFYQFEVQSRYRVFKCDEYTQKAVYEAAFYMTQPTPVTGLLFCGSQGNGKTTIAKALLRMIRVLKNEGHFKYMGDYNSIDSRIITATEIAHIAKSDNAKALQALKQVKVLVIDDLGEEPVEVNGFGTKYHPMREVLEARYDAMLFTIITTNLTADEMPDYYGWRVVDRFREMYKQIVHKGPSYR